MYTKVIGHQRPDDGFTLHVITMSVIVAFGIRLSHSHISTTPLASLLTEASRREVEDYDREEGWRHHDNDEHTRLADRIPQYIYARKRLVLSNGYTLWIPHSDVEPLLILSWVKVRDVDPYEMSIEVPGWKAVGKFVAWAQMTFNVDDYGLQIVNLHED